MRKFLIFALLFFICFIRIKGQDVPFAFPQLYQLDSIGKTASIAKHFGSLYFNFLKLTEEQLKNSDTATRRLVRNFEIVFAQLFITSCSEYQMHNVVAMPAWRSYFSDTTLQPIQYKLLGANAHLNGGLAEAIALSYSPAQWKEVKKQYYIFNVCLDKTYADIYKELEHSNKRARFVRIITLGFDKKIGQYHLYKWRKRQMRLTEYFYSRSPKYYRLLKKINTRKKYIDRLIVRVL